MKQIQGAWTRHESSNLYGFPTNHVKHLSIPLGCVHHLDHASNNIFIIRYKTTLTHVVIIKKDMEE